MWNLNDFQQSILDLKYIYNQESFEEFLERITNGNTKMQEKIKKKNFLYAGRILANRGLNKFGHKVTYSNCYVLHRPLDNLESIYKASYQMAKTFSHSGGVGLDISNLRPNGAKVSNTAKKTTGAVSFMELFNLTSDIIGQNGRRGATMISMSINHPDIEEFIDIKTDLNKITKANISVRITDEFMNAVKNDLEFNLYFKVEDTGEEIKKTVKAKELFYKLAKNNWDYAEPGILYWDNISNYNLMSEYEDFEFGGVNPCAEAPLPEGGSCLLGSINLSSFVDGFKEYNKNSKLEELIDIDNLVDTVREAVIELNNVLDEGLPLHPLKEQRESVGKYRQIGLGIMGYADMLIKIGVKYGSDECLYITEELAKIISRTAILTSIDVAKEKGQFELCDREKIANSTFIKSITNNNPEDEIVKGILKYGIRNSQVISIAPTGSISTMLGISGGIEPIFCTSYVRKTQSLHGEDRYHKIYTPVIEELIKHNNISDDEKLPEYVITSQEIDYNNRIKVQAIWQKYTDSAISSTINLANSVTVDEVMDIYIKAWENNLKGMTVYRDGCKREGVLITEKKEDKKADDNIETIECPDCGNKLNKSNGCVICLECGYSPCS